METASNDSESLKRAADGVDEESGSGSNKRTKASLCDGVFFNPDDVDRSASTGSTLPATDHQSPSSVETAPSPVKLVLKLNYSKRDQLFTSLNELSAILQYNQSLSDVTKQRTHEKIKESVLLLMDLPSFEATQATGDQAAGDSNEIDQLTFELSGEEQTRMISHLVGNQNAVTFYDKMDNETKRNLVTENKRIVVQLLDLPGKAQGDFGADLPSDKDTDKNNGEPPSKQRGR